MAKTISDEQMKLTMIINGNSAQKELLDLEKSTKSFKEELSSLTKEEKKRQTEFEKANATYMKNKTSLNDVENSMKALNRQYDNENAKLKKIESLLGKTSVEYKIQKKVVDDLEASGMKLWNQQSKLQSAQIKLSPVLEKSRNSLQETKKTIDGLNISIAANKAKADELRGSMKLTDMTLSQLNQKATILRMTLKNLVPSSPDFIRYQTELTQVNARLDELRGRSQTARSSIGSLADTFNRYQGIAVAAIASLTGAALSIQKIIDINGKLSDAQADVMKTTGMTKVEVDELTKSFGLLQTRTSRIDLLGIAEQGGRIGIAKEEIGDFVNVMNKAAVALGDSFTGGPEEVSNKLGKIKFLFQETKDLNVDESYNAIGSAINDLGANGVASEANIAEFTTRIGSLPDLLKPTIQETLALGAAFEESGIEAEVSSRAYGIFLKQASTETGKFAQVMGISEQKVKDLINANPLEFMLNFSKGLKEMSDKGTDVSATLDFLGISADGANKVIGAMGNNTARFRELIDLSNNSFATGTSLINEYNVKNNNLAATLEKISKTVSGWFSSETFIAWLTGAVDWLAKFIGATEDAEGQVRGFRNLLIFFTKTLIVLVASYVSYSTALQFASYWSKTVEGLQRLLNVTNGRGKFISDMLRGSTLLLSYAYNSVTGNTIRANAAMKLFNTTVKISPIGILLTTAIALGVAFFTFKKNADDAAKSIKKVGSESKLTEEITKNLNSNFAKSSTELKSRIEPLISVLNNQNVSLETRKKAYEQLIKISPDFVGTVDKEFRATDKLKTVYTDLLAKMQEKMRFESMKTVLQSKYDEEAKALDRLMTAETKAAKEKQKLDRIEKEIAKSKQGGRIAFIRDDYNKSLEELTNAQQNYAVAQKNISIVESYRTKQIENLTNQQKKLAKDSKEWLAIQSKINALIGTPVVSEEVSGPSFTPGNKNTGKADDSKKKQEDKAKKLLEDTRKLISEQLKLEREAEDIRLSQMDEGLRKEIIIEQVNLDRKIADLEAGLIKEQEIKDAFAKANNSKNDKITRDFWLAQGNTWKTNNDTRNQEMENAIILHNLKIATLKEKAAKDQIEKEEDQFEIEKANRETAFNNELNALGLNDQERKKRQEEFDKKELSIQKEHLEKRIGDLKNLLAQGILTPEAKEKLIKAIAFLELAASKIELAKYGDKKSGLEEFGDAAKSAFGDVDILGFTPEQWEATFTSIDTLAEKMAAVNMVVAALQNAWSAYANYQNAVESAQLKKYEKNSDAKKAKLKKQLDHGMITQETYNKRVAKIDEEYEKQKAELEYKRAKREKAMALVGAIINTAKGVAAALPNLVLSALAATMGALQIATIAKQPLPAKGYEEGLYPEYVKRSQDGKTFRSRYGGKTRSGLVSDTSHFLVAENGPEMVIDNKAWRQMDPAVKDALVRNLQGIKGFEQGLYNQETMRYEVPATATAPATSANDAQLLQMVLAVVQENTATMKYLQENGVYVTNKDLKSMKNLKEGIQDYENLRNKAKN